MKRLKTIQKQVIYLTVVEQRPAEEVANRLGISIDNVYQIKKRAIAKFLSNLEGEGNNGR